MDYSFFILLESESSWKEYKETNKSVLFVSLFMC